jgi:flavodoxin
MNVLVAYVSLTGNTKKIAEAIFDEITGKKELKTLNKVSSLEEYGVSFIGFPIHKFGPPEEVQEFLATVARGNKIALFNTHALPSRMEMVKGIQHRCRDMADGAECLGLFHCQGEVVEEMAKELLQNTDPRLRVFGAMREISLGHPDEDDLQKARIFTHEILAKVR